MIRLVVVIPLALLVVGLSCARPDPTPSPTSEPEPSPAATSTSAPTATPEPTPTAILSPMPTPTRGPTAVPSPTSALMTPAFPDVQVDVIPRWQMDDQRVLEIVKSRKRWQDDRLILQTTNRTEVTILVLDVNTDGYVLAWTFGETRFDDPDQADNPLIQAIANLVSGLTVKIHVDQLGSITKVLNWEEIRTAREEALEIVLNTLKETGINQAVLDAIAEQVVSTSSSEEQIRLFSLREAQLYFLPLGWLYTMAEPIAYEDLLSNPFGGEPLPSKAQFLLKEYDKATGDAVIEFKQSLDAERTTVILHDTMKGLALKTGGPAPKKEDLPRVSIEDSAEYVVKAAGWVSSVHHSRTVRVGAVVQSDTVRISDKTPSER